MYSLILQEERDCATCTRVQKRMWGCEGKPIQELMFDGELLERCPRRPLLDDPATYSRVFWLYRNYDRGILAEEGALLSQPQRLLQMFEVIDLSKSVATDEQQKRDQLRAKLKNHG